MKFKVGQRVLVENGFACVCDISRIATVVIVDDEPREAFPYLLRLSNGHEVWFPRNGLEACQSSARVI